MDNHRLLRSCDIESDNASTCTHTHTHTRTHTHTHTQTHKQTHTQTHTHTTLPISLAWPDLFLALGIITCSISAQRKKGSGQLPIQYLFYCHHSGSTNLIAVFKLI